jgi:large subunit ribosomal protein L24
MKKLKQLKKLHVKLNDKVRVISGKDKGKIGVIKRVIKETSQIVIEGVNIKSKHRKVNKGEDTPQIQKLEYPIHSSNVTRYQE